MNSGCKKEKEEGETKEEEETILSIYLSIYLFIFM